MNLSGNHFLNSSDSEYQINGLTDVFKSGQSSFFPSILPRHEYPLFVALPAYFTLFKPTLLDEAGTGKRSRSDTVTRDQHIAISHIGLVTILAFVSPHVSI